MDTVALDLHIETLERLEQQGHQSSQGRSTQVVEMLLGWIASRPATTGARSRVVHTLEWGPNLTAVQMMSEDS